MYKVIKLNRSNTPNKLVILFDSKLIESEIPTEKWLKVIKMIGMGEDGQILLGRFKKINEVYVIKVGEFNKIVLKIHKLLNSQADKIPNIQRLYGAFSCPENRIDFQTDENYSLCQGGLNTNYYRIYKYYTLGDLTKINLNIEQILGLYTQLFITYSLLFIYYGFIHNDINPYNILVEKCKTEYLEYYLDYNLLNENQKEYVITNLKTNQIAKIKSYGYRFIISDFDKSDLLDKDRYNTDNYYGLLNTNFLTDLIDFINDYSKDEQIISNLQVFNRLLSGKFRKAIESLRNGNIREYNININFCKNKLLRNLVSRSPNIELK